MRHRHSSFERASPGGILPKAGLSSFSGLALSLPGFTSSSAAGERAKDSLHPEDIASPAAEGSPHGALEVGQRKAPRLSPGGLLKS